MLTYVAMGRSQEKIARVQETYLAHAIATWLESLERSLVQMKEYQVTFSSSKYRTSLT